LIGRFNRLGLTVRAAFCPHLDVPSARAQAQLDSLCLVTKIVAASYCMRTVEKFVQHMCVTSVEKARQMRASAA
jgi:hypothetical protein